MRGWGVGGRASCMHLSWHRPREEVQDLVRQVDAFRVGSVVFEDLRRVAVAVAVALVAAYSVGIGHIAVPLVPSVGEAVRDVRGATRPRKARGTIAARAVLIADSPGGGAAAVRAQQEAGDIVHGRERRVEPRAVGRCIDRVRGAATDVRDWVEPAVGKQHRQRSTPERLARVDTWQPLLCERVGRAAGRRRVPLAVPVAVGAIRATRRALGSVEGLKARDVQSHGRKAVGQLARATKRHRASIGRPAQEDGVSVDGKAPEQIVDDCREEPNVVYTIDERGAAAGAGVPRASERAQLRARRLDAIGHHQVEAALRRMLGHVGHPCQARGVARVAVEHDDGGMAPGQQARVGEDDFVLPRHAVEGEVKEAGVVEWKVPERHGEATAPGGF
mmetsp:Transcript_14056/g.35736  ORF Transcript_14056/g.35736 Transcript_14056/m.35736 type:complete len:389 (-) Transcript_14056:24-1190(-)